MTIGTGIMLLALQQPVDVAESIATLDVICGGALCLGLGLDTEMSSSLPLGSRVVGGYRGSSRPWKW
jgi:hypothetical protein